MRVGSGQRAAGRGRVWLRPLAMSDAPDVAVWLAEAVAAVQGRKPDAETPSTLMAFEAFISDRWPGAQLCGVAAKEHGLVGLLAWRPMSGGLGDGSSAAVIEFQATRHDARDLGYGMEAIERLEERSAGITLYSATPRGNGLALYFWLHGGFRPVRLDEDAALCLDPERFWMVRPFSSVRRDGCPAG